MTDGLVTQSTLADDLLRGQPQISEFLGIPKRKVYYMLETGQVPAFKLGALWHARKSTLLAHIARLESGEA